MADYFRKKAHTNELITTFDDVLLLPGYTSFGPNEVDISTKLGEKYKFNLPIMSAAMDTVTEEEMAIKMTLFGGLGVLHRNCSFEKQLKMVRHVKRARSFIIEDVATISPEEPLYKAKNFLENYGISGLVVLDENNKVCGIFTKRDIPYSEEECKKGHVKDFMTREVISIKTNASRKEALEMLFKHRIEKLPIIDNGNLKGLITKKDLKPEFPLATIDEEGRLLCALAISPKYPTSSEVISKLKEIDQYTDIFFIDVADFYKKDDIESTRKLMDLLDGDFVVGNIGTYEAAEFILTKCDYPEKLIALKVGMGSGSICTTSIQTGVGAPTLFATAEVADAIADYNPKMGLIADGGFKNPGDLPKAFAVGANMIMSGHFFAGTTESPGYLDTIQGRKVKIYRGMGSKEARTTNYVLDRYSLEAKMLPEGVSDYVPFTGPLESMLETLKEGLANGMIYTGAQNLQSMRTAKMGVISAIGQSEAKPHDLLGKY